MDQLEKEKTEAVAPQTAAPAPAASAPAAAAVPAPKVVASAPDNAKKEGVIKWYNGQSGFGIIEPNLYFHITEVDDQRLCVDGARVSYRLGKNDKGPCAKSIHIISTPEQA